MRLFIAIPVPCTLLIRSLLKQLREMGTAIRTVDPSQFHITVKFLGDVPDEKVPQLKELVWQTQEMPIDRLNLFGLGAFPRLERPEVIWIGVERNPSLIQLNKHLEDSCAQLGFPRETRSYSPHLTLARIKRKPPAALARLLAEHTSTLFGEHSVPQVVLYRSDLRPSGPIYTQLDEM